MIQHQGHPRNDFIIARNLGRSTDLSKPTNPTHQQGPASPVYFYIFISLRYVANLVSSPSYLIAIAIDKHKIRRALNRQPSTLAIRAPFLPRPIHRRAAQYSAPIGRLAACLSPRLPQSFLALTPGASKQQTSSQRIRHHLDTTLDNSSNERDSHQSTRDTIAVAHARWPRIDTPQATLRLN